MSLPAPKLDDRDFDSLVEEAKRRIAAKCPQWTDFNVTDPGMMLVELMAWMTETTLYRLNRVPELNYVKFLELIGLRLRPARPARAWVFFQLQPNAAEGELPVVERGTVFATRPQGGNKPISFRTLEDVNPTASKIIKAWSLYHPKATPPNLADPLKAEHDLSGDNPREADLFIPGRAQAVPHHLYLGATELADELKPDTPLEIKVELARPALGPVVLQWEAWEGENGWQNLVVDEDKTNGLTSSGSILFRHPTALKKFELSKVIPAPVEDLSRMLLAQVQGLAAASPAKVEGVWLRARLIGMNAEAKNGAFPEIRQLEWRLELKEANSPLERMLVAVPPVSGLPHGVTLPPTRPSLVEAGATIYPFGTKAAVDSAFYLQSQAFEKAGATIFIHFDITQPLIPSGGFSILWEYSAVSNQWKSLGNATPQGVTETQCGLTDETNAFTVKGKVSLRFRCPLDVASVQLDGQAGRFIRARVQQAAFDPAGGLLVVQSVSIQYSQEMVRPWQYVFAENYSAFHVPTPGQACVPFLLHENQDPAFYLCFDQAPPSSRGKLRLYLDVVPQTVAPATSRPLGIRQTVHRSADWHCDSGTNWQWKQDDSVVAPQGSSFIWEYSRIGSSNETDWRQIKDKEMDMRDDTDGFAHPGMVEFNVPDDWQKVTEFQSTGFWLRVRWVIAEFVFPPRIRGIWLNGVEVEQRGAEQRVLGSSSGLPHQQFSLHKEILEQPQIWIREIDLEPGQPNTNRVVDLKRELKEDPKSEVNEGPDGYWVKWSEQMNLHKSGPTNRHFVAELREGRFRFGDGVAGRIPPPGRENIKVIYDITVGAAGNVGANTINVLESNVKNIQGVTNFNRAEGGADREEIEEVKRRGPWEVKHRTRAVTAEDFVELARKASPLVAKAFCFSESGVIHLVVIPNDSREKPQPGQRLIREVSEYLEDKRLINSRITIQGPFYEPVVVEIKVALEPGFLNRFEDIRRQIITRLKTFVHPVTGLDDSSGWPTGRTLHLSELYYLLEKIPGVDHIEMLTMKRSGSSESQNSIKLDNHSLPFFSDIKIERA